VRERERALARRALSVWGVGSQTAVALEELGELSAALSRFVFRRRGSLLSVATEVADVQICLEQMAEAFGGEEFRALVGLERRRKLQRLEEMLGADRDG
jgi:hypothetical protein